MKKVDSSTRQELFTRLCTLLTASRRQTLNYHRLAVAVIALTMVLSIGFQSLDFYQAINPNVIDPTNQSRKNIIDNSLISSEDFQLLFGFNDSEVTDSRNQEIPLTKMNLILRGALSGIDNKEYASAIIQTANQDKLYEVGDALPGGAFLHQVHSDHIVIKRGNRLEKLYFPETARDTRTLYEHQPALQASAESPNPGSPDLPNDVSLDQRMQDLRDRLQEASREL